MKGYIYKYTFPNGKIYIGQTRRPLAMRHAEHLNLSTGPLNPGFWEAYQTVGTPVLSVLETIEDDDLTRLVNLLNRKETEYIFNENATDPNYGYNRKTTATSYSPDVNILNKEFSRLCKEVEKEKRPFFKKLSEKLFNGKKDELSEEEKAFVSNYIEHNNIFVHSEEEQFFSEEDSFAKEEGFMFEEAVDYAIWLYNEETREIICQYIAENASEIIRRVKQGKIIQQLDMDGNVLREFASQDEIREALKIVRIDNIINVIKGRQKTAYGFMWRYKGATCGD